MTAEPTTYERVAALAAAWGHWQEQITFPYQPDHCINGSRVAVEVLRRAGIKARPMSVRFMLFNRFGWDMYSRAIDVDKWPPHAWSLGVSESNEPERAMKWHGHLMVEGEGFTLDMSARQFARPGLIESPSPLLVPIELPTDGGWAVLTDEHQQVLIMNRWPENKAWRHAPGWLRPPDPAVIRQVERRMRAALESRKETHD